MIIESQWIVGFTDGEGCFHIGISKNQTMKLGFQVLPEFTIVQHQRDVNVLYALKDFFQCGVVRKNHGDVLAYRVRNQKHLREIIIPFFEQHKLKTKKRVDFLKFRRVVRMMVLNQHLTSEGLEKIQKLQKIKQNLKIESDKG